MNETKRVQIESDPMGRGVVKVDGVDVSSSVNSISIGMRANHVPEILLGLSPSTTSLDIEGIVAAKPDGWALLAGVDAEEIDREAMNRKGWDDDRPLAAIIIEILKEKLT